MAERRGLVLRYLGNGVDIVRCIRGAFLGGCVVYQREGCYFEQ